MSDAAVSRQLSAVNVDRSESSFAAFWKMAGWPARVSLALLAAFALAALFAPAVAPYDPAAQNRRQPHHPPMRVHLAPPGEWSEGLLYVHKTKLADIRKRRYEETEERIRLSFFKRGRVLTTADPDARLFLLGTDALGRDFFSRLVYGGRISLSIGLVGVAISYTLGILIGAFSGYVGGRADFVIMRATEILMSLPTFYFLLTLAVIIPATLPSSLTYLLIVAILSFIGWAGLARIVRGLVLSEREREYVLAARAMGASGARVLVRHVVPSTFNYAVVSATLSIPGYILGESALSFLGLGIKDPDSSWGLLLAEAQNVEYLLRFQWLLIPGLLIFLTVMAFNFLGDALRDHMDPKRRGTA